MSEPDRSCEAPGCERPATVHLTQIVDNKSSVHYLCVTCAQAKGISPIAPANIDVSDFLSHLGETTPPPSAGVSHPCSRCGLTFDNFKESGRLGCPRCYTSFESGLRRLLNRIHGATRHVGKVYLPPDPAAADLSRRLDGLRRRLRRAVETEDFERAAVLRDEIIAIEPAGKR